MLRVLFIAFVILLPQLLLAQVPPKASEKSQYTLATDTVPEVYLERDTIPTKKGKKKKLKKGLYYGLKCRRGVAVSGVGDNQIIESFWYLKEWKDPNPYIDEIYVFDVTTMKVMKVPKIDPKKMGNYRILHGPYKKTLRGEVLEEGIFYVGVKHGRWERYDKNNILLDKTKYFRGWPKEAKMTYYGGDYNKIEEVVPYENGQKTGEYYYFFEDGSIKVKGNYENGEKIGLWVEFSAPGKRKRETEYPKDAFDTETKPIVRKEWDDAGALIVIDGNPVAKGSKAQQKADPIKQRLKRK
jgi:antitoxin component YwqK of YwqJK toxin-antitoxin module